MNEDVETASPPKAKPALVELRPLVGYCRNSAGQKLRVTHPVDQVLLRGRQVGTCGIQKGAPLNLLNGVALPGPDLNLLLDAVQAKCGQRPTNVVVPPGIPDGYSEEIVDEDDDE